MAHMNILRSTRALVPLAALAVSACATTSDGLQLRLEDEREQTPVTFDWDSQDDVSGNMTATLSDGRRFTGSYFVSYDSGKVLASLSGMNGERLRCLFRMVRPSSGMSGGGEGECQLINGITLGATFPPAQPITEGIAGRQ
jgi:hypothetical protein